MKAAVIIFCMPFLFGSLCVPVLAQRNNDDDDDDDNRNGKRVITTKSSFKGPAFRRAMPMSRRFGRKTSGGELFNREPAEDQVDVHDWKEASMLGLNKAALRKLQLEAERLKKDEFWVERLKRVEFSPNLPYHSGHTYLHFAAWNGLESLTAYLLSVGADPKYKTPQGLTASDLAERRGHRHIIELLNKPPEAKPES